MNRSWVGRLRAAVLGLSCALGMGAGFATGAPEPAAPAEAQPPSPEAWVDRFIAQNLLPHWRVNAAHDEPIRQAATAMVTEHLPRVRALMLAWWREEQQGPQPTLTADRVMARTYNEFGLWSLDSMGPAHDALVLQALQSETTCHPVAEPVTEMDQRLGRLRGLPPPALAEALAHERALLARWGQPRVLAVAEPQPVAALIERVRRGDTVGLLPLPSLLRSYGPEARAGQRREVARARALDRCLLHHWALRSELARPEVQSDPVRQAQALARFREGLAIRLPDLLWIGREAAGTPLKSDDGYPELPKRFGVTGRVTLWVDLDAKGQLMRATVHERQLRVPGVPSDVRPVVFEALLDDASVARAKAQTYKAPASDKLKDGVMSATQAFVWTLN